MTSEHKMEAIANADAHLGNAGLPTYSELVNTVERLLRNMANPDPLHPEWRKAKADAAVQYQKTL